MASHRETGVARGAEIPARVGPAVPAGEAPRTSAERVRRAVIILNVQGRPDLANQLGAAQEAPHGLAAIDVAEMIEAAYFEARHGRPTDEVRQ